MPTYRWRLRVEGGVLAGCGLLAADLLVAIEPSSTRNRWSTLAQEAVVLVVMAVAGRVATRRAMAEAVDLEPGAGGTGQPTALWKLPPIVAVLTLGFGELVSWDTGMRAALGCAVVGLAQAILIERLVATDEARSGWRYYRVPGSRILRGTRLGRARH
ncbi:MAG: hypothetical protein QOK25_2050 [Thermoleophilaceae bacterium]|jgi:hypothetical protein|nr:hypothetical protein [Thermoleophilaceae bacterium]